MPEDRPNVLFLMSDQHSHRHLSHRFDGAAPVSTPTLDGIAERGVDFGTTYAQVPLCTPSRMCLLTGREAQRCSAWENWHRIPPGIPTLPETLSEAGYDTCLVGKMHLGGNRQFVGFDERPYGDLTGMTGHQHEPPKPGSNASGGSVPGETEIPESLLQETNTVRETVSWLREQAAESDDPWFLTASFSRPHPPLTAPGRFFEEDWPAGVSDPPVPVDAGPEHASIEGGHDAVDEELRRKRAAYFACVDYFDELVGDLLTLLEAEGHLENTIVVYASDHGELAGERGLFGKGRWLEGATRVPLLVETPAHRDGERAGATVETPVSLGDLFPTLCGLTGVEAPDGLDGTDLSAAVETGAEPDRGPVVCDYLTPSFGHAEFRMVRDGDYKYVTFPEHSDLLFDLGADPHERESVLDDPEHADAAERLGDYVAEHTDWGAIRATRRRDEEELPEVGLGTAGTKELLNLYHMPDGRVVDGDAPLYNPRVIAEDPERIFEDYPTE
jgi:choline-sulfatase